MGRVVYETVKKAVDKETGVEVSTESATVSRLPSEPNFVKLYIDDLSSILKIPDGPKSLIWLLVRQMSYDGIIAVTPGTRRRMSEELSIKEKTLRNYLWSLCQSDVLRRIERGEYELNPSYFGKGHWSNIYARRRAWAKLEIVYDSEGHRQVQGSVIDSQSGQEEQQEMFG